MHIHTNVLMSLKDHASSERQTSHQIFNTKKIWTFVYLTWPGFLFAVIAVCSTVLAFFFSFFFSLSAKVPRILDIISESVFAYWIRCFNYLKTSYFSLCWRLFTPSLISQILLLEYTTRYLKLTPMKTCQIYWVPNENKLRPMIHNLNKVRFKCVCERKAIDFHMRKIGL